jgi:hypothetical protein
VPSKRPGSPLGLLSCGCLENGVAIHMGIMRSRYERSFLRIPSRRFVCLALLIGATLVETLVQSAVSVRFLTVHLPPPTIFTGSITAKSGRNILWGSAVLDRTRALSGNAIVAAMPSLVVELIYERKGSTKGRSGSPAVDSAFVAEAWLSSRG